MFISLLSVCSGQKDFPVLQGDYLGQNPPGDNPEVFAPGIISHGFHEHSLTISPDGNEMFYVTSSGDHRQYAIVTVKRTNNVWTKPEIAAFSGKYRDMGPCFSPDGKKLFFCSYRPLSEDLEENPAMDIWVVEKQEEGWSKPVNLGSPVNTDKDEILPSVSSRGTLYFQSYDVSKKNWDFYFSRFENGKFQKPVKLEYGISSVHQESHPVISPDESHLIFQSIRPGGIDGVDFYISYRKDDDTWTTPVNLGEKVSSPGNVISPFVSPDGKYFFFARNGPRDPFSYKGQSYSDLIRLYRSHRNGYGCLYWMDAAFIKNLKSYN